MVVQVLCFLAAFSYKGVNHGQNTSYMEYLLAKVRRNEMCCRSGEMIGTTSVVIMGHV
jgi:hypothetical protein